MTWVRRSTSSPSCSGDIPAVSKADIAFIWGAFWCLRVIAAVVAAVLRLLDRQSRAVLEAEGLKPSGEWPFFMLLMAVVTVLQCCRHAKIVGIMPRDHIAFDHRAATPSAAMTWRRATAIEHTPPPGIDSADDSPSTISSTHHRTTASDRAGETPPVGDVFFPPSASALRSPSRREGARMALGGRADDQELSGNSFPRSPAHWRRRGSCCRSWRSPAPAPIPISELFPIEQPWTMA